MRALRSLLLMLCAPACGGPIVEWNRETGLPVEVPLQAVWHPSPGGQARVQRLSPWIGSAWVGWRVDVPGRLALDQSLEAYIVPGECRPAESLPPTFPAADLRFVYGPIEVNRFTPDGAIVYARLFEATGKDPYAPLRGGKLSVHLIEWLRGPAPEGCLRACGTIP